MVGKTRSLFDSFLSGLTLSLLTVLSAVFPTAPIVAGHLDTGCYTYTWSEQARENNIQNEDGVGGEIRLNYPDTLYRGIVRALIIFQDADNWAEIGWAWFPAAGSDPPQTISAWTDDGTYNDDEEGSAGSLNDYPVYRLWNDTGTHWKWRVNGADKHGRTFASLNDGFPLGNMEVKNTCDTGFAHFRELRDKDCNTCSWAGWGGMENWVFPGAEDHPYYHTDLDTSSPFEWFYVRHN
ncbi:MAG: hypothetical protein ACRDGU_07250 [Actinomycetota bacterium]